MAPEAPIVIQHRSTPAVEAERVAVFTVSQPNPDHAEWVAKSPSKRSKTEPAETIDVVYSMVGKPNPGAGLEYLRQARGNADLAASWLIEKMIGSDGYTALVDELEMMSGEEAEALLMAVAEKVKKIALGGLEAPKG